MININEARIGGRIGQDLELRYTSKSTAVVTFSVATSEKRKNPNGIEESQTEWHRIVVFGQTAEWLSSHVKKGSEIYIEGKIQTRSWDDKKTGAKRYMTEIIASRVELPGKRKETETMHQESLPMDHEKNQGPDHSDEP